jgi:hypothetical protein
MDKNYFKYYKPGAIVPFLLIVGTLLSYFTTYIIPIITNSANISYYQFPSVTILIGIVVFIIDKWLWKYPPFSWLFWIDDFSGRYEGTLCFQYQDNGIAKSGELEHIKIISQTGSSINVASFTKKQDGSLSSPSNNKGMYVEFTQDGQHFNLIYNYLNEGSIEQGFPPHYGTEVVKVIKDKKNKELSGRYFTDRTPFQTKGEFKNLKWTSNNKTHDF